MTSVQPLPHMPHQHFVATHQVADLPGLRGMLNGQLSEKHDFRPELRHVLVHRGGKVTGCEGLRNEAVGLSGQDDALICVGWAHGPYSHGREGRG